MSEVEERRFAGGTTVVHSSPAPGREGPNEDAAAVFSVDDSTTVLAVADGVGGFRGGEQASALAVRSLAAALEGRQPGASLRAAILDGFEHANAAVRELGVGAATTLAVLEIAGGAARSYHVGDSIVLLVGQRGRIKLQTISHSPVGFAVEAGVLDEEEAMHHEDRHVVSNVLGAADMRIEMGSTRRLALRDTALLASDGVLDNLHIDEIVDLVRTGAPAVAGRRLRDRARRRMTAPGSSKPSKPDDVTFVLYRPSTGS